MLKLLIMVLLDHLGLDPTIRRLLQNGLPPSPRKKVDQSPGDAERLRIDGQQIFTRVQLGKDETLEYDLERVELPGSIDKPSGLVAALAVALFDIVKAPITNKQVPFLRRTDGGAALSNEDIRQIRTIAGKMRIVQDKPPQRKR